MWEIYVRVHGQGKREKRRSHKKTKLLNLIDAGLADPNEVK